MRWGTTARATIHTHGERGLGPIRHAWDGLPAKRKHARVHAICGAPLRRLGPRDEQFDPKHPRTCNTCRKLAR